MRTLGATPMRVAFLLLGLASACGSSGRSSFATPTGTGYLRKSDTLWIVNLQGSYQDMGKQYGALLRSELQALYAQMDAAVGFDRAQTQEVIAALKALMDPRETQLLQGMQAEAGLSFDQLEFLNASLFFMYANLGCSAFAATGTQTTSGHTIAGRNFDNPRKGFSSILSGRSILVIYNPRDQFTGGHRDNAVAAMTQIGWIYGLTDLSAKGIYLEYNNGTNSIPIDPVRSLSIVDGLHQNLYAAFDSDTLEEVDARLAGVAAVATMTQVADQDRVWHHERSPYENARKILAGEAHGGSFFYANPPDMDIFTNHFFFTDWANQRDTDPATFNLESDSGSKTLARLVNLQELATAAAGQITVERMKEIMTARLTQDPQSPNRWIGGPFIAWEIDNPDVTHFTSVTDVAGKVMHIYPNVDALAAGRSVQWSAVDLNREFR